MQKLFLTLGSSRVRLAIGLVLAGLLVAQIVAVNGGSGSSVAIAGPELANANANGQIEGQPPSEAERLEEWARTDHVKLLQYCLRHYQDHYKDYTCVLAKQERIGGEMGVKQIIDIKFKEDPFSVLMTWRSGAGQADKLLYVENPATSKEQWQLYVHPTGVWGKLFKSVPRSPYDPEVMKSSLRTIDEFGFERGLRALIEVYQQAIAAGHLKPDQMRYVGTMEFDGRPCFVIERVLPPNHDYPANLTQVVIDQEYLVPVKVYGTDWQDNALCNYEYTDLKFNVPLTDEQFTRKANELD